MKTILKGRIDHLNFKNGEPIRSTLVIRVTRSTIIKLSIEREKD
jgi:hypothetical protein